MRVTVAPGPTLVMASDTAPGQTEDDQAAAPGDPVIPPEDRDEVVSDRERGIRSPLRYHPID